MPTWKIATVQMDCTIADKPANLKAVRDRLREAAKQGAQVVIFPECIISGYCYTSKAEAWPHAEPLPGPATDALAADCRELGVWVVVGLLERDGDRIFNACALVGPDGFVAGYRKAHLPCLGIDRYVTPGDRPFAVHDIGGLHIGMNICYDGSFPETARVLMLLGADLVVLPTNWPEGAMGTVKFLIQARAAENTIFYAACNRVGQERGFCFIGHSRIIDVTGELLAQSDDDKPAILYAEIDPARAREKRIVKIPAQYELHRIAHRRPELYEVLCRR